MNVFSLFDSLTCAVSGILSSGCSHRAPIVLTDQWVVSVLSYVEYHRIKL